MRRHLDFQIVDDDAPITQLSHLLSLSNDSEEPELMPETGAPLPGADIALYTWGALAFGCVAFVAASVATGPAKGPALMDLARTAPVTQPQVERVIAMSEDGLPQYDAWTAERGTIDPTVVGAVPSDASERKEDTLDPPALPEPLAVMEHQRTGELQPDITSSSTRHAARLLAPDGTAIPLKLFQRLAQRAPDLMGRLEASSSNGDLLAGPFSTRDAVVSFCRSVVLRLTLGCDPVDWPKSGS
ncbi:MAG: hypothetical protein AAGF29_08960 [Pseudomonadota bacterium]